MNSQQRNRGRILTPEGLSRLQRAIVAWELEHEVRCTQEKLRELTIAQKPPNGLDPGTISKILEAQKGVDPKSIRCLFKTLGLQLDEADLISSARLQAQADPNFVGREGALADLNLLVERGAKVIVIQARGGVGKTALARKYLQQEFGSYLEFPIAKETKDIASIESLLEEKLRQLGEEPGREFFVSLDRLKRKLQSERFGILIDNLEPALDSAGKFIEPHRRYVEFLRVLADPSVQSTTLITTRERLRESSITAEHYMLRSLDIIAWEQFFQSRDLATDAPAFAALHNAYGGNAKAMDIIRGAILEDYSGDVEAYWQANQHDLFIERDLEDLVVQQFNRLQQIDADAYNLLCRIGCYRYQDVPNVPVEGLTCLLWDVPEDRKRRVVRSLQDRSLVEANNGEYCLHPIIREEAIERLRGTNDWLQVNYKAGEFWTEHVKTVESVGDALRAFEAYYHYVEAQAFEEAGKVIIRRRKNKWYVFEDGEQLGGSFIRLGLLQQIKLEINQILECISSEFILSKLYFILGNTCRLAGEAHQSIAYFEKSILLANLALESICKDKNSESNYYFEIDQRGLQWIVASSLMNIGNCKIDLWELEEANEYFEMALKENVDQYLEEICNFRLAFLNSCLGIRDKALYFAEKSRKNIDLIKLNSWARGYRFLSLALVYANLNNIANALDMYNQAFIYAEESHYTQVKARALAGLAAIHRIQNEFQKALKYHNESIELLKRIGAKCDLAEAYYQVGLTYQAIGEVQRSRENFHNAIQSFDEMKAPRQVRKVKQAMAE